MPSHGPNTSITAAIIAVTGTTSSVPRTKAPRTKSGDAGSCRSVSPSPLSRPGASKSLRSVQRQAAARARKKASSPATTSTWPSRDACTSPGISRATTRSGCTGRSGSMISPSGTSASTLSETSGSRGSSERSPPRSASIVASREPDSLSCAATRCVSVPRCSASSRCRNPRMALRIRSSPRASITRLHSVSKPMERLFRFAEPIVRSSSSMMSSLACTLRDRSSGPGILG